MTSTTDPTDPASSTDYSAAHAYRDYEVAVNYERARYSSVLGRYRWAVEQRAVGAMIAELPSGISVLDCPCGTGRWWKQLRTRATRLVAADISTGMLRYAGERAAAEGLEVQLIHANAAQLPLENGAVDYVFSHALTKHLPRPTQYAVLAEFARVARRGVLCSFGVFTHLSYEFWRRRRLEESYPLLLEELHWMAAAAGLDIVKMRRCTTPLGVERTILFRKIA